MSDHVQLEAPGVGPELAAEVIYGSSSGLGTTNKGTRIQYVGILHIHHKLGSKCQHYIQGTPSYFSLARPSYSDLILPIAIEENYGSDILFELPISAELCNMASHRG